MKTGIEQSSNFLHPEQFRNNYSTIALEGPVCAEKSTLLNSVSNYGFSTIDEYSEYVSFARLDFPSFPPSSPEVAQVSFQFFLELEKQRFQDLPMQVNKEQTILDRSIHTLLAFEVGAKQITGIDILPWAMDFVLRNPENIFWSDHIVYLDLSPEESLTRANSENHKTAGD